MEKNVIKKDNREEAIVKTGKAAGIGAGAGVGVAALVGGPVAVCGLIGGGLVCLAGGIFSLFDDKK